jgi:hypothetical protein
MQNICPRRGKGDIHGNATIIYGYRHLCSFADSPRICLRRSLDTDLALTCQGGSSSTHLDTVGKRGGAVAESQRR